MFYAEINENNKVYAVSDLSKQESKPTLILLDSLNRDLIGSYYSNGTFERIQLFADKVTIAANGTDKTIITAQMPTVFTAAEFKTKIGEIIASVPVVNGTATLEVTATSPGEIVVMVEGESIKVVAQ